MANKREMSQSTGKGDSEDYFIFFYQSVSMSGLCYCTIIKVL